MPVPVVVAGAHLIVPSDLVKASRVVAPSKLFLIGSLSLQVSCLKMLCCRVVTSSSNILVVLMVEISLFSFWGINSGCFAGEPFGFVAAQMSPWIVDVELDLFVSFLELCCHRLATPSFLRNVIEASIRNPKPRRLAGFRTNLKRRGRDSNPRQKLPPVTP